MKGGDGAAQANGAKMDTFTDTFEVTTGRKTFTVIGTGDSLTGAFVDGLAAAMREASLHAFTGKRAVVKHADTHSVWTVACKRT